MTMWRLFQGAVAFMLEVLVKRINNAARQSRITTVTQMAAALGLFRLIGYNPPGRQAATVAIVFTLASVLSEDVPIPVGYSMKTGGTDSLTYRALEASVISAGQLTATVQFKNDEMQQDFFLSNGRKNQKFLLTYSPLVFNGDNTAAATIAAANGSYTQAPNNNLFYSGRADKHYEIYSDDLERGVIRFGDGVNGEVPVGQIQVDYETGGGLRGNVASGLIDVPVGNLLTTLGNLVTFTAENEDDSSGGDDRPTLGRLKWLAPLTQTASPVTVKRSDFATRAMNVSGVDRAIAVTNNQDAGISDNTTHIYIVPSGGGTASETLQGTVKALFKGDAAPYPTTETHQVEVFSAIYRTVDWRVVVYLREGVTEARARAAIVAARDTYFATRVTSDDPAIDGAPNPDIDFGGNLKNADGDVDGRLSWSDMLNVVRDLTQVRRIEPVQGFLVNEEQGDVLLLPSEFPEAGNIIMINGATGEAF